MEIEGTLTLMKWQNPHVLLEIEREAGNGETEHWYIESGGPTLLHRLGVTAEIADLGDRVSIAGYPSRVRSDEMIGVSIGLADGRSMPLFPTLASRFGHQLESGVHITRELADEGARTARGIFRVWTYGRFSDRPETVPSFTPQALAGREGFDPLVDDPALRCIPHGMPRVMQNNPFPIQFTDRGDQIILETEVWDIERTIHLSGDEGASDHRGTPLGYSVGRWEGDTLVVSTTDIDWPYFDPIGTPQSERVEVVERFTLSADESRLDYEAVVTDPETLLEPAVFAWHWEWVPGEELQGYSCTLPEEG